MTVDGQVVWLDPMVRFAPFGELPELALGEREAWVLPRPGEAPERTVTAPRRSQPGKSVVLTSTLDGEGVLAGEGVETYQGFEAAQLAEALEQLTVEQRRQALEQALSRMFGGADLEQVDVDAPREVGAPVRVSYRFKARRFARPAGEALVFGALTFPWNLGRRYLVLGQRQTPLFIESSEATSSKVTLTVPEGLRLKDGGGELTTSCDYGRFRRRESQAGRVITVEEEASLCQGRVPPEDYAAFGRFAGEADLFQQRDVVLGR